MCVRVYLGLGSNLGDKCRLLHDALTQINERIGTTVSLSSFYETVAWGFRSENTFLNAVVAVDTPLDPFMLLQTTQEIECSLGRTRKSVDGIYHDRPIDIDILFYGDAVIASPQLTVPHPEMTRRRFVMEPLVEIAPDLRHPLSCQTVRQLWQQLLAEE